MVKELFTDKFTGRGVTAELYTGDKPKTYKKKVDGEEITFQLNPGEYLVDYGKLGTFPYNGPHFHEQFRRENPPKNDDPAQADKGRYGGVVTIDEDENVIVDSRAGTPNPGDD